VARCAYLARFHARDISFSAHEAVFADCHRKLWPTFTRVTVGAILVSRYVGELASRTVSALGRSLSFGVFARIAVLAPCPGSKAVLSEVTRGAGLNVIFVVVYQLVVTNWAHGAGFHIRSFVDVVAHLALADAFDIGVHSNLATSCNIKHTESSAKDEPQSNAVGNNSLDWEPPETHEACTPAIQHNSVATQSKSFMSWRSNLTRMLHFMRSLLQTVGHAPEPVQ
jgi:hypothetical protein